MNFVEYSRANEQQAEHSKSHGQSAGESEICLPLEVVLWQRMYLDRPIWTGICQNHGLQVTLVADMLVAGSHIHCCFARFLTFEAPARLSRRLPVLVRCACRRSQWCIASSVADVWPGL